MSEQKINGQLLERINEAILAAYDAGDLERMVLFSLNQDLYEIAGKENERETVFDLVKWAQSQGRLGELVQAAAQDRPHNQELQALAGELSPDPRPASAIPTITGDPLPGLYATLIQASGRQDWDLVLALGAEIQALDADYLDVPALLTLAQQTQEREQNRQRAELWQKLAEQALAAADVAQAELALQQWRAVAADTPEVTDFDARLALLVDGGVEFVEIPAGEFWMGSDDQDKDERPRRQVILDTYQISRTPVTNAQYGQFVQETGHAAPKHWPQEESGNKVLPEGKENHPVVHVSWADAHAYCHWLGDKRGQQITLPTEAQWEKAARGPEGLVYPWGNDFDQTRCNSRDGGVGDTTPVDKYPQGASLYGVLDMSGNVWEWVQDWYADDYYAHSPDAHPTGPPEGSDKVVRGGPWYESRHNVRAADRHKFYPTYQSESIGFRCARHYLEAAA
jgi:formylglycine-generating enzyme required for sulfatase activity